MSEPNKTGATILNIVHNHFMQHSEHSYPCCYDFIMLYVLHIFSIMNVDDLPVFFHV